MDLKVYINDKRYEFVKKLAKYDNMTVDDEINVLLSIKIDEMIKRYSGDADFIEKTGVK